MQYPRLGSALALVKATQVLPSEQLGVPPAAVEQKVAHFADDPVLTQLLPLTQSVGETQASPGFLLPVFQQTAPDEEK